MSLYDHINKQSVVFNLYRPIYFGGVVWGFKRCVWINIGVM